MTFNSPSMTPSETPGLASMVAWRNGWLSVVKLPESGEHAVLENVLSTKINNSNNKNQTDDDTYYSLKMVLSDDVRSARTRWLRVISLAERGVWASLSRKKLRERMRLATGGVRSLGLTS